MEIFLFIISFLFVFGLLVFVHEFGHFIVAKLSGVEVLEFGFGFPPALYKRKKGKTVYSINAIPFGGFVKLLGEDGSEPDNPKSFASQKKLTRAKIISAGVLMNFILAWAIFSFLFAIGFSPFLPGTEKHKGVAQHFYVADIEKGTPAYEKGIQKNDEILAVNDKNIKTISGFVETIKSKIGQEVSLEVKRGREIKSFNVIPFKDKIEGQEIGRIGISIAREVRADSLLFAPLAGLSESLRLAKLTVLGIVGFFGKLLTTFSLGEEVVGPVGIAVLTNQVRQLGFTFLLQFIAILSVSLALLNIMPIPGLDGGHLLLIFVEKIRGKEVSRVLKNILTMIGLFFLIILIIAITTKDITRFGIIDGLKKIFGF